MRCVTVWDNIDEDTGQYQLRSHTMVTHWTPATTTGVTHQNNYHKIKTCMIQGDTGWYIIADQQWNHLKILTNKQFPGDQPWNVIQINFTELLIIYSMSFSVNKRIMENKLTFLPHFYPESSQHWSSPVRWK